MIGINNNEDQYRYYSVAWGVLVSRPSNKPPFVIRPWFEGLFELDHRVDEIQQNPEVVSTRVPKVQFSAVY